MCIRDRDGFTTGDWPDDVTLYLDNNQGGTFIYGSGGAGRGNGLAGATGGTAITATYAITIDNDGGTVVGGGGGGGGASKVIGAEARSAGGGGGAGSTPGIGGFGELPDGEGDPGTKTTGGTGGTFNVMTGGTGGDLAQPGTAATGGDVNGAGGCLLYTSPSPRDRQKSRMPSSA